MATRHIVRHDGLWRLMELLNGGKMIDGPSSERIDVIRFPLIVGVVFVHNFATVIRMSNSIYRCVGQPILRGLYSEFGFESGGLYSFSAVLLDLRIFVLPEFYMT